YRRALALTPCFGLGWNGLGNALSFAGRREEALAAYRKAVTLEPRNGLFHYNLAVELRDMNRPDEAIAAFQQAVAFDAQDLSGHYNLGRVLLAQGRLPEAAEVLRRCLMLLPENDKRRARPAEVLQQCETRLRVLGTELPALLRGETRPSPLAAVEYAW